MSHLFIELSSSKKIQITVSQSGNSVKGNFADVVSCDQAVYCLVTSGSLISRPKIHTTSHNNAVETAQGLSMLSPPSVTCMTMHETAGAAVVAVTEAAETHAW